MTSPPSTLTTLTPASGPRSDAEIVESVCDRRDIESVQAWVRGMSKRDAVEYLAFHFPRRSPRWYSRNLERLTSIDPEIFWRLTHADPTGEEACRRVMAS